MRERSGARIKTRRIRRYDTGLPPPRTFLKDLYVPLSADSRLTFTYNGIRRAPLAERID